MERSQRSNILLAFITLIIIIVVVSVIGLLTLGKGVEVLQGQADVTEYRVSSKVPGRVLKILVKEGEQVKAGDTLAVLEAPDIEAKLAQAQALEEAAQALSNKARKGARSEQINAAYEMWQKAKAGLDISEKTYTRINRLFEEGVISAQKRDEAYAGYKASQATEKAAKAQYDMAVNGAEQEDKKMADAKVAQARGAVEEVNSYIKETFLLASDDGEVTEIFPHEGELIGSGSPIMNIARMNDMWVSFNIREDYLRDYRIGEEIEAQVPALDRKIKVRIYYMKDLGTYAAWKATKTTGQFDYKTFEMRARPVNQPVEGLRPGMSVIIDK